MVSHTQTKKVPFHRQSNKKAQQFSTSGKGHSPLGHFQRLHFSDPKMRLPALSGRYSDYTAVMAATDFHRTSPVPDCEMDFFHYSMGEGICQVNAGNFRFIICKIDISPCPSGFPSAHPFRHPTPFVDFAESFSIRKKFSLPSLKKYAIIMSHFPIAVCLYR